MEENAHKQHELVYLEPDWCHSFCSLSQEHHQKHNGPVTVFREKGVDVGFFYVHEVSLGSIKAVPWMYVLCEGDERDENRRVYISHYHYHCLPRWELLLIFGNH